MDLNNIASAKRKNDAVITVCQDNDNSTVIINGLNEAAERLTGFKEHELHEHSFLDIVGENFKEDIEELFEFDNNGDDLASLLNKTPHFFIINESGKQIPVSLKVFYVLSSHAERPQFEILMRDITLLKEIDELKATLIEHKKECGKRIPSRNYLLENLQLIQNFEKDHYFEASLALVQVNELAKYEDNSAHYEQLLEAVYKKISATLRDADVIACLEQSKIALILFDCNTQDTQSVLLRLKEKLESSPIVLKQENAEEIVQDITLNIGACQIVVNKNIEDTINICQRSLQRSATFSG